MQLSDFTFEVRNRDLTRVGQITPEDLDITITDRFNNVGEWELKLPSEHPMATELRKPGAGIIMVGPDGGTFYSGRTVMPAHQATPMDVSGTVTVKGVSDSIILADALAWPTPSSDTMAGQVDSHDVRTDDAESLLHHYVWANIGPGAPASRRNARLAMGANGHRGPVKKKSARFPVLGNLLAEIAATGGLGFRVIQRGDELHFETYAVTDRSGEIRLDIENGTLAGHSVAIAAPGVTHVVVAGQGAGVDRAFLLASSDASRSAAEAWDRRIERFVDQRQTDDEDEYQQRADEILDEQGFTGVQVKIVPLDDENSKMRFWYDWRIGDIVTVVVDGVETKDIVTGYKLKADSDGFSIGAIIGDDGTSGGLSSVSARLSNIEANSETGVTAAQFHDLSTTVSGVSTSLSNLTTVVNGGGWVDVTLNSPWVSYGGTWPTLQYRRLPGGEVALRGMVRGGLPGTVGTLPVGFRPDSPETFPAFAAAPGWTPTERPVRIEVHSNGDITIPNFSANSGATGGWTWVSFAGVRFTVSP